MVYSIFVVPGMLGKAGFDTSSVFIAVCLTSAFGSLLMGLWANLPIAVGCAISLTTFTAFDLVLGQGLSPAVALGAVFLMGVIFTAISATGVRSWILRNLPTGIAHGTGIGIGLFLLLIAAKRSRRLVVKNPGPGLPVSLGAIGAMPALLSVLGLAAIFGLERRRVPGGILLVMVVLSVFGLIWDPAVTFKGLFALPSFGGEHSLIGVMDVGGALNAVVIPSVLALGHDGRVRCHGHHPRRGRPGQLDLERPDHQRRPHPDGGFSELHRIGRSGRRSGGGLDRIGGRHGGRRQDRPDRHHRRPGLSSALIFLSPLAGPGARPTPPRRP